MSRYQELIAEAEQVYADCQEPNWNGYESEPITDAALKGVKAILAMIFDGKMEVNASPDGGLSIDRENNKKLAISIVVEPNGKYIHGCVVHFEPSTNP